MGGGGGSVTSYNDAWGGGLLHSALDQNVIGALQ